MFYRFQATRKKPRVVFVTGLSHCGKTTLIERLIPRLREEGFRVGTLKHAHEGHEVDRPGKDSHRHAQAGACAVTLISPKETATFVQTEHEMQPAEAIEQMAPQADLILAEGFKESGGPKILIEPGASCRLRIEHRLCRIGVLPMELSSEEINQIIQFCRREHGDR